MVNMQAPTIAELDPAMQALVVSHETLPGGQAINAGRAARGFAPLDLLVVPLLGMHGRGGGAAGAQGKLSSSELRARESEEQRQRGSAQQQHEA